MATAFETISDALVAALRAAPAICSSVMQENDKPIPDQLATAVNVHFAGGKPSLGAIREAPVDWESRFEVELYARSNTGPAHSELHALMAEVYARIAADTTLGGLVTDTGAPHIGEPLPLSEGQRLMSVTLSYSVLHRTQNLVLE